MLIELCAKDSDVSAEGYDCGINVLTYSFSAVVEIVDNLEQYMREVGMGCGPPRYFLEEIRLGVVTLD